MTIGKNLKMIIYTRTANGTRRIDEVDIPLQLCSDDGELSVDFNCRIINDYLKSINTKAEWYEEITYYLSGDEETVTLQPNKLKKERK